MPFKKIDHIVAIEDEKKIEVNTSTIQMVNENNYPYRTTKYIVNSQTNYFEHNSRPLKSSI